MGKKKPKRMKRNYEVEVLTDYFRIGETLSQFSCITRQQAVEFIIKHEAKGAYCKLYRLSNPVALEYETPK